MKRFLIILTFIATFCLWSCQNDVYMSGKQGVISDSDSVTLTVGLNVPAGRSAMPNIDLSDISYISLSFKSAESDSGSVSLAGWWENIEDMKKAAIPFRTGTFDFTLTCCSDSMVFTDKKSAVISTGANNLTFTPKMELTSVDSFYGKGALSVSIRYDDENVKLLTGGLYTLDGDKVAGFADQVLVIGEGGNSTYAKSKVPSGNYILVFSFYADTNKKLLLSNYREYCSIVNGKTSVDECVMDSMANLYTINYKLDGGSFTNGLTTSGNYTRQTATIKLPSNEDEICITKNGYTFAGWYKNADFSGYQITEIPSGSAGDVTFYAKWLQDATITFNVNSSTATIQTSTQTVQRGVEAALTTANDLGLSDTKNRFLGWADKSTADKPNYSDGGAITVTGNKTIYAVWSVANINPESAADTKDSDGDGLSDWDEIHKYFTDPASADTDGDGWTDGQEVNGLYTQSTNTFNPLIADTPQLEIRMTGKPSILYTYSLSETQSDTVSASENDGVVASQSNSNTNTKSRTETHGWSLKIGESYHWDQGPVGFTLSGEEGYNGSIATGDSYTYSKSASESWSKSFSKGESSTKANGKTITGGKLSIPIKFKNPSNIAYTVKTATIALYRIPNNENEGRSLVANLNLPNDKEFTINAGSESGEFKLGMDLPNIAVTEQLLKYSVGFEIEVSGYKISLSKEGKWENDFTEALTEVRAKTAAVFIDWGPNSGRSTKTYNVAVKNLYNTEAQTIDELYEDPDLDYIFQKILRYTKGNSANGYTLNSNGYLESIYNIANKSTNAQGAWFICHKYTYNGERRGMVYAPYTSGETWKLSDIKLNAGDEVSIIYSVDKDGDGVPLNEELIYGISDDKQDTDGDGLTDYEEIYGWYKDDIGLDSKYSSNNKVYTNPLLTDSDGDELLDYSADNTKCDSDPIIPKRKDDATLGKWKYLKNGKWEEIGFAGTSATISGFNENICLDIQPKYTFGTVQYKTSADSSYVELNKNIKIDLNVGTNTIYILSTAPDRTTTKEYTINVNSSFKNLNNFKIKQDEYGGGIISLTWDNYADGRATANDGGYILYGSKGNVTSSLSLSDIASAQTDKNGINKKDSFYISLGNSLKNSYTLELVPNTEYTIYLFAYAHSGYSSTFQQQALARSVFYTKKTKEAIFKFYAHYIYGDAEHDGSGSTGEYWWKFDENAGYIGLNDYGQAKSSPIDLQNGDCWSFGDKQRHGSATTKFGDNTKVFEKKVTRGKDIEFTVKWDAYEDDTCNTDYLGQLTATFKYSASSDSWTCSYSAGGGDGDGARSNSGSKSVSAGSRTSNMKWDLANPSKGEISMHCDMGWDE